MIIISACFRCFVWSVICLSTRPCTVVRPAVPGRRRQTVIPTVAARSTVFLSTAYTHTQTASAVQRRTVAFNNNDTHKPPSQANVQQSFHQRRRCRGQRHFLASTPKAMARATAFVALPLQYTHPAPRPTVIPFQNWRNGT